jgi:hypothetical protein
MRELCPGCGLGVDKREREKQKTKNLSPNRKCTTITREIQTDQNTEKSHEIKKGLIFFH